jgi:cell division transport system permease protein
MQTPTSKRRKPNGWPSILSLTSVLFLLGLVGFSILGFQGLSERLVESSSIDVYFDESSSQDDIAEFQRSLERETWVKSTKFISREEGLRQMGEKFDTELMTYAESVNLPLSVEVYPKAEFAQPNILSAKVRELRRRAGVEDVLYQKVWVEQMAQNIKRIQLGLLVLAVLMTLVSAGLIQSATRLGIYSNRFIIKSMQLVGATNAFIVRPFVWRFIQYALAAFPLAAGLLWGIIYGIPSLDPAGLLSGQAASLLADFNRHIVPWQAAAMLSAVGLFGILLAGLGSWISTRKYLKAKIENLY